MGEVLLFGVVSAGIVVFFVVVGMLIRQSRRTVVKPTSQEDMVERILINISAADAIELADELKAAAKDAKTGTQRLDHYEKSTDRLFRFLISK